MKKDSLEYQGLLVIVKREGWIATLKALVGIIEEQTSEPVVARANSKALPPAFPEQTARSYEGKVALIKTAADCGYKVKIGYTDEKNEYTTRTISKPELLTEGGIDYLFGQCELRGGPRKFRLTRIYFAEVGEIDEPKEAVQKNEE